MKSIYHGTAAANCKLRGKKIRILSCRCCVLIDIRDGVREKEKNKEISDFRAGAIQY